MRSNCNRKERVYKPIFWISKTSKNVSKNGQSDDKYKFFLPLFCNRRKFNQNFGISSHVS